MKYIITVFQDEDGMFITEYPQIPGCISQGKTEDEAVANIRLAIQECLEVRNTSTGRTIGYHQWGDSLHAHKRQDKE